MIVDFLKYILEFFYSFFNDFGISIILVSFSVMLMLLPFNWISEKINFYHKIKTKKIQDELNGIKNLKNKKEKFYYTQEIYRKNNYKSYYSLITLSGLLIQIPFFLAIYWLLIDYPSIKEVSFGPINDLSLADNLIKISSFSINLLPFVMTLVNILATFFNNNNINKKEKIQLLIISIVFFFLLYDLPSALLLYWTMNNVFSILKDNILICFKNSKFEKHLLLIGSLLKKKILNFYIKHSSYLILLIYSIFPIMSFYLTNIEQVYFNKLSFLVLLVFSLIGTAFAILISSFILKNKIKVQIFVFTCLSLFFFYGHLASVIKTNKIILPIYLIILFTAIYVIFKSKLNLINISKNINFFVIIITSLVFFRILIFEPQNSNINIDVSLSNSSTVMPNQNHPDIYYIILDGYSSSKTLKNEFNYDNKEFENFLINKGFFIGGNSTSNYFSTFLALPSILNLDYINFLGDSLPKGSADRKVPYSMIQNNNVNKYLKNKGYKTFHFGSIWGPTIENKFFDYDFPIKNTDDITDGFIQTTLLKFFFNGYNSSLVSKSMKRNFEKISNLDTINSPKFVFAHMLSPHPPYIFDENGNTLELSSEIKNEWNKNELEYYLGQISFLNKKIKILVNDLLNKSKNTVIIIQSDHGSYFNKIKDINLIKTNKVQDFADIRSLNERFRTLNAIYISDSYASNLYNDISSVNTFRVIFNSIFDENLKILKDSNFLSDYDNPYEFIDVTKILSQNN